MAFLTPAPAPKPARALDIRAPAEGAAEGAVGLLAPAAVGFCAWAAAATAVMAAGGLLLLTAALSRINLMKSHCFYYLPWCDVSPFDHFFPQNK